MSLILVAHFADRVVVAADRRVTADRGGRLVRVGTAPKFIVLGRSIIASVGRMNHVTALLSGVARFAGRQQFRDARETGSQLSNPSQSQFLTARHQLIRAG